MLYPVSWQRVAVFVSATTSLAVLLAGCNCGSNSDHSSGPELRLLPRDSPGKCLDGTPGGYYVATATNQSSQTKWVIRLQGGGECASAACLAKTLEGLGSSAWFPKIGDMQYLTSRDPEENPLAATWNHIFIMYCSQDLWSGTRTDVSQETWGLHFSGHLIFKAVVEQMMADLQDATDVVLTGESAGGIGVWINQGWLKSVLPATTRLTLVPIAGFYGFAHKYVGPGRNPGNLVDFSEGNWPAITRLWNSHLDEECARAIQGRQWACMLSNYSRQYLNASAFVVEAQTDAVQLADHDDVPKPAFWNAATRQYVEEWKQNMTFAMHNTLLPGDGYFFPACYLHTEFSKDAPVLLRNQASNLTVAYGQAVAAWYIGQDVRLEDACGVRCGHCPKEKDEAHLVTHVAARNPHEVAVV